MANVFDYIAWRGDIPFSYDGFHEVDGLILSQFSYLDLEGIVAQGCEKAVTMETVGERYFALHQDQLMPDAKDTVTAQVRLLWNLMRVHRYKKLKVMNYNAQYDTVHAKQFGAVTVMIGQDYYVVFRGTDDTLAGWREDFQACYKMPIESQIEAARYLETFLHQVDGNVYVMGHSKGGNLAMYASMSLPPQLSKRVVGIYNYDGPGFMEEVVSGEAYQSIKNRVHSFLPRYSIIGMILHHESEYTIVGSDCRGIMQHLIENWSIYGTSFVREDGFDKTSLIFNRACRKWITEIDDEKREFFVELVFSVLTQAGDSFGELWEDKLASFSALHKAYWELDKPTRKMAGRVLGQVIKLSTRSVAEDIRENRVKKSEDRHEALSQIEEGN